MKVKAIELRNVKDQEKNILGDQWHLLFFRKQADDVRQTISGMKDEIRRQRYIQRHIKSVPVPMALRQDIFNIPNNPQRMEFAKLVRETVLNHCPGFNFEHMTVNIG